MRIDGFSVSGPILSSIFLLLLSLNCNCQLYKIKWAEKGDSYYKVINGEVVRYNLPDTVPVVIVNRKFLTLPGDRRPVFIDYYTFSADQEKMLLFTNTVSVYDMKLKGDYFIADLGKRSLTQLGKTFPESSLMFAKFSPDGRSVAYVCRNNIYLEDLATSVVRPLTTDGNESLINGAFDESYNKLFSCHDGFRWRPDGKYIAYWQIDAGNLKKFSLINNTDSLYPLVTTQAYSVAGRNPSSCRVGVVNINDLSTTWMKLPGEPDQHYIVRMEFIPGSPTLLIQQLNRKQNQSRLYIADIATGDVHLLQEESDDAWVDIYQTGNVYDLDYINTFNWMNNGSSILWSSEKDGWRHLFNIPLNGQRETLVTRGEYDFLGLKYIDKVNGYVYFLASPDNATKRFLYRTRLDGTSAPERVTPREFDGSNNYSFSADGNFAAHSFQNHCTQEGIEFITIPGHQPLNLKESLVSRFDSLTEKTTIEFFRITTCDKIELDGWLKKPKNFDPAKKYPVVFYVYTEPYAMTVRDLYGISNYFLYQGNMSDDGYILVSLDNRGTPAPKGRTWRKSIYRKIGLINIRDQAMGAKEILKWNFVDSARVAVMGWSGGGTAVLNLMFRYPEIFKTGISIAAVVDQRTYDNIYSERYMGLPNENMQDYINGSPITYAKNLSGKLLYIHGTGDENVHYQNAEMLINELVKYNKQFEIMPYPNRNHGIYSDNETWIHFKTLITTFLKKNCPPGGK